MSDIERFCDARLTWPGHPDGSVPCERLQGHAGLHCFEWHVEDGTHSIQWSDAMAQAAQRGDWP